MNEKELHRIPEDEYKKDTKEMCDSCIHKSYCMVAYMKDHWCGNHRVCKKMQQNIKSCKQK